MTQRIVVTGGEGALARALRDFLPGARYLNRTDLDVRRTERVSVALRATRPDVVIHAAAVTTAGAPAADLIETNVEGTRHIAAWCRAFAVRLVYLSTHGVYGDNAPEGGWCEHHDTAPVGAYAWSKLAGERWAEWVPRHVIVRGSWYTRDKVRYWAETGALVDAWCSRESMRSAARKIADIARDDFRGVVNIAGPRRTFHNIVREELPGEPVNATTLADVNSRWVAPYVFPRDTTICDARWRGYAKME